MDSNKPPNILFVVWDACRLDYAKNHAPTLNNIADENLQFTNAITPGGFSLPSHMSMVTGEYPHKHGVFALPHSISQTPLIRNLNRLGYSTYGVSANGFASPNYNFDKNFDEFYNTQAEIVYPEGLDIHKYRKSISGTENARVGYKGITPAKLTRDLVHHPHTIKSITNLVAAGIRELVNSHPRLTSVPHPRFNDRSEFCYNPDKNTRMIESILRDAAETDEPFFLFTNYMDAHHPYAPKKKYQEEFMSDSFNYRELNRLSEISNPFDFTVNVETGNNPISDDDLEKIRRLYAAEIRTADRHLNRMINTLTELGLRDDTMIIITADHGENLGETDEMNETRIGHVFSSSDLLTNVPLVVAHPEIDSDIEQRLVSLKDIYTLLSTGLDEFVQSNGVNRRSILPKNGIVSTQIPAKLADKFYERYPEIREILERHICVSYMNEWKVVSTSKSESRAWKNGKERQIEEAPDSLLNTSEQSIKQLVNKSHSNRKLGESERKRLESLGYL